MEIRNNIWKFYGYTFFSAMFFVVPIIVLFLKANGLSFLEIMVIQSSFAVMMVVLEVPTGYLADVKGRRSSMIWGTLVFTLAWIMYALSYGFWGFLAAELVMALGWSLLSGADVAMLYDSLSDMGREKEYSKIYGKVVFIQMSALAVSNVIGGYIGAINLRWAYYMMIPAFLLAVLFSCMLKEPKRHKAIVKKGYLKEILEVVKFVLIKNKKLKWLTVYAGIITTFLFIGFWAYQPYFELSGLKVAYFGIVFACFQLIAGFSGKYAHVIEKKLGEKYSLVMLLVLMVVSFVLMSNFVMLFSFSFVFLQQFVRGFQQTVFSDYFNKLTDSSMRATVMSVKSMVERLFIAVLLPISGVMLDLYTIPQAFMISAVTLGVLGTIILILLHKDKVL